MKRRMVGMGGVFLILALLGIFGWYFVHTQSTQAELNRAVAEFASRKPVAVTFVIAAPPNTPKEQVLYLSGSVPALGNWDAAGVPLTAGPDGKYVAVIPDQLLNGLEYKFKVTRGTWGTVEADATGKDGPDHVFTASADAKVPVVIAGWIDNGQAVPGRVTMTGDIRLHKKFHSALLNNDRTLIVYLPPNYEKNTDQRYPVLYLQDGQNLFDEATSYQGIEWKLDEAAQKLSADGKIRPAILVGVYNTETRTAEFTPPFASTVSSAAKPGAKGDVYAKMMSDEVKPFIDQRYRTLTGKNDSLIGGGSMGGLIALFTAKSRPDVFGQVVALSPWLRLGDTVVIPELIGDGKWLQGTKIFFDMGTDGGNNYPGGAANAIPDADLFAAALEKAGLKQGTDFEYRVIEGGKHNESSWQATADQMLLAVFGIATPPTTTAASTPSNATAAPGAN